MLTVLVHHVALRIAVEESVDLLRELEDYQQQCWARDEQCWARLAAHAPQRVRDGNLSRAAFETVGNCPILVPPYHKYTAPSSWCPAAENWTPAHSSYVETLLPVSPPTSQFASEFDNPLLTHPENLSDRLLQRRLSSIGGAQAETSRLDRIKFRRSLGLRE